MKKEEEKIGTLLGVGNAFIPVHTFNKEEYVALFAFKQAIKFLEEENKKLKKELEQAIYWKVDYEKSYKQADAKRDELLEENKKLREKLKYYKEKSEFLNKVIVKYEED